MRFIIRPYLRPRIYRVPDHEVRRIFERYPCRYAVTNGIHSVEVDGIFVRRQRSNGGSLGYVFRNPLTGESWLWVINAKNRKPFPLARVN